MPESASHNALSASASAAEKLGVVTMTDVALMRPRASKSRMPRLTPGEMP